MTNILAIINALGVPIAEIVFWDVSVGVVPAADLVAGRNILGQHVTQRAHTGILCYWMQHYFPIVELPACECRGSLYPLPDSGEAIAFWRVAMENAALPGLSRFHEVRNPWYSDAGLCAGCFHPTPASSADVPITIEFHSPDAIQAGYVVAGRLLGFDFPQDYLDKERSPGVRARS